MPHLRLVHRGLSRHFDLNYIDDLAGHESGWDRTIRYDARWLAHLPICLNSILHARERDIEWMAKQLGQTAVAECWRAAADARTATMIELMWDDESGFFYDYDYEAERRDPTLSLAGFPSLWSGLANQEQANGWRSTGCYGSPAQVGW